MLIAPEGDWNLLNYRNGIRSDSKKSIEKRDPFRMVRCLPSNEYLRNNNYARSDIHLARVRTRAGLDLP
jgi:hypothetical protein